MKRVVITGIGILSCIGNNKKEVLESLLLGSSGISFNNSYKEAGLRSCISGSINIDLSIHIEKQHLRFMSYAAAYSYIAMREAIDDASLTSEQISNDMVGIIAGSGGASPTSQVATADILRSKGVRRVGPYTVTKNMSSTVSACLATPFKIKGINYSISSACATSLHAVGNAYDLISTGKQDIIFAGGGEEESWAMAMLFDGMGALSTKYNESPTKASRAFDKDRDGFVIAGGAAMLVIESLDSALKRNAKIYAEILGFGANSDGHDMVAPSGEGAIRCMNLAMKDISEPIDYINMHGTSTPVGDIKEIKAIKATFSNKKMPMLSSTKSMTGHSLGATGAQELVYSILMMENGFIAPSINIENIEDEAKDMPIVTAVTKKTIKTAMSNSFGFGGTNGSIVIQAYNS